MRWKIAACALIAAGFLAGLFSGKVSTAAVSGPTKLRGDHTLVSGHARAITGAAAGEKFSFSTSNSANESFSVVPKGKKLVITDVIYQSQLSVSEDIVVNIANASPSAKTGDILFQVTLGTRNSNQVHLCSGYEIRAGNSVLAYTGAGYKPQQYVSISTTGYLEDE